MTSTTTTVTGLTAEQANYIRDTLAPSHPVHVEPGADGVVSVSFSESAAERLHSLGDECDGYLDAEGLWIGGDVYPAQRS